MSWLAWLFAIAVVGRAGVRLWLATRQIAAVDARRSKVPRLFAGDISVDDHERSADYSVARMRITRVGAVTGAAVAFAFTFGGGIAVVDNGWRAASLEQPWLGVAVVLTVLGLM
jgi:STE24 endopeptidase